MNCEFKLNIILYNKTGIILWVQTFRSHLEAKKMQKIQNKHSHSHMIYYHKIVNLHKNKWKYVLISILTFKTRQLNRNFRTYLNSSVIRQFYQSIINQYFVHLEILEYIYSFILFFDTPSKLLYLYIKEKYYFYQKSVAFL